MALGRTGRAVVWSDEHFGWVAEDLPALGVAPNPVVVVTGVFRPPFIATQTHRALIRQAGR